MLRFAMKKNVYEEQEEKRRKYAEEHTVECPHCGEHVLDHMTKCPHCGKPLEPVGYTPLSDKRIKRIKLITFLVGMAIAAVVVYFLVLRR